MPRRGSQHNESAVSLFPFLSILACMIGTLTLMITALALTGMDSGGAGGREEADVRRAEQYVVLTRNNDEQSEKIKALRDVPGEQGDVVRQRTGAQGQITQLEKTTRQRTEQLKVVSDLKSKQAKEQQSVASLERQKKQLEAQRQTLRTAFDTRTLELSAATVKILPPSHGKPVKYRPYFVEARKEGLVLHQGAKPHTVGTGAIGKDKSLNDLLTRLSGKSTHQLVLLIRHNGLSARGRLLTLAAQRNVICGQIPLIGDGILDLSGVKTP